MADEKLNVSPEENPQPSLFDTGPADAPAPETSAPEPPAPENIPEQAAVDAPAQDAPAGAPGKVSVSADQIEKLMAERRAAERAEVEKNEPPEPEQPPTPAPEEKAAGEKGPAKKDKAAKEKTPEPDKPKGRRGRKPKEEKAGPGEPGGTGARRGRPAKADKAATDKPPAQPRDKMSQGKGGKAATVKGKEETPAAPPPAPEVPPQPRDATRAEKEEIVYLNLSELFPFKDHPFGVRDDAEMKGLVESVKDNGVHQPALVRPREGGGYEIIAGHRRQRASELAGFANMPCIVSLLIDIENSIKAAQSKGYEQWAKIHNLKQAAKTMNFLTEHKIEQYADLVSRTLEMAAESGQAADALKNAEKRLADMAVLIKNVSTYQKTKPVYDAYRKARNREKYRAGQEQAIILHEAAARSLKAAGIAKLPNLAALQSEYEALQAQKEALYADYGKLKKKVREYDIIKQNIDSILQADRQPEREKGTERG